MASYLPIPITAVHTTNKDYCHGEGLLSRYNNTSNISVLTDGTFGRMLRYREPLGGSIAYSEVDIPAGVTGITFAALMKLVATGNNGTYRIITFLNASNQEVLNIAMTVPGTGLSVRRGTTVLGVLTTSVNTAGNFFEFDIEFNDSTGVVVARVDNTVELNLTGVDTINNTGPVTKLRFGAGDGINTGSTLDLLYGHGYIKDRDGSTTFWGRGITRFLPYTADVSVQFTATGSGSNNNDRIKETDPDGDTTYVSSSTDTHRDTYGPPNASGVTGAVKCLWNYQGCKQDGSAILHSVLDPDSGSLVVESTGRLVPLGAYGGVATAYENNPDTASNWTGAEISAIDAIGFELEVP